MSETRLDRYPNAYYNDDGQLVREESGYAYQDGQQVKTTYLLNLSAFLQAGRRTTAKIDHLVIEAELLDEHGEVGNPAYPINKDVAEQARERIRSRGLTPAWEVV